MRFGDLVLLEQRRSGKADENRVRQGEAPDAQSCQIDSIAVPRADGAAPRGTF
jgi:hypothetical protein